MNKDWSEKNKQIQMLLGKKTTYKEGIKLLIEFRQELFQHRFNVYCACGFLCTQSFEI